MIKKLLLLLSLTLILISCEKENVTLIKNSHRIKNIFYHSVEYDLQGKIEFTYEEEKLTEYLISVLYEGNWEIVQRNSFNYEDDIVKMTFSKLESTGMALSGKVEFKIHEDKIEEELYSVYFEGKYFERLKWEYAYSGKDIIGWKRYEMTNENRLFKLDGYGDFIYQKGKITSYTEYEKDFTEVWNQSEWQEFIFNSDNITNWIIYETDSSKNWLKFLNCNYVYYGEQISAAQYQIWNSDINAWEANPVLINTFTYNENGYLIKEDVGFESNSYAYEEGHGNAILFWYAPDDLVADIPHTLKCSNLPNDYVPYYQRINNVPLKYMDKIKSGNY